MNVLASLDPMMGSVLLFFGAVALSYSQWRPVQLFAAFLALCALEYPSWGGDWFEPGVLIAVAAAIFWWGARPPWLPAKAEKADVSGL